MFNAVMAPPLKRRRLSGSTSQSQQSRSEMALFEPMPTLPHAVNDLSYPPRSTATRHIEEVHLQIQQRSVHSERLHHRQAGAIESAITSVDADGNSIVTTVTAGLSAGAATLTSDVDSLLTQATDEGSTDGSSGNATSTGSSPASNTDPGGYNSSTATSTKKDPSAAAATGSSNSTLKATKGDDQTTSSRLPWYMYTTTLKNGDVKTITRSNQPYVTTFGDGQVSTICDRQGQCRLTSPNSALQQATTTDLSQVTGTSTPYYATGADANGAQQGSAASSPTGGSNSNNGDDTTSTTTGAIAGGVVGGAAGLAVLLLAALVFLRWFKKRRQQGHIALPEPSHDAFPFSHGNGSQPGMTERARLTPLITAIPALFRHQDRRHDQLDGSSTPEGEKGFTKVSGRKLPSQFSAGMDSPSPSTPTLPSTAASLPLASNKHTSFQSRDSRSASPSPPPGPQDYYTDSALTLSPGPERTPTIYVPPDNFSLNNSNDMDAAFSPTRRHARGVSGTALISGGGGRAFSPIEEGEERSDTPPPPPPPPPPRATHVSTLIELERAGTPSSLGEGSARGSRFMEDV